MEAGFHARPQAHREVLLDRHAENSAADVIGCKRPALHRSVRDRLEVLGHALPQHLAAPAQVAADEVRGEAVHHEPRHLQPPSMQQGEGAAVARCPVEVADCRVPVVTQLIDEAEAKPDRIGKVDAAHSPRIGRLLVDAVGGKGEWPIREALAAPASVRPGIATTLRRIFGVELGGHQTEGLGRQPGFERAARPIHDEDVVALLDARRRKPELPEHAQRDRSHRAEPRLVPHRDPAHDDQHGRDDQQRVAEEVVDRQPQRRDHEEQRGELQPGLAFRVRLGLAVTKTGGGQCAGLDFAERYRL